MTVAFADTSFYIAVVSTTDAFHDAAISASNMYRGSIMTTEYVLIELGNYLSNISRNGFLNLVNTLRQEPKTDILPSSPGLFDEGLQLYSQRQDKDWSLTDCISSAVMQQRGITDAFTLDHHFEQAGFHLVLNL